MDLAKSDVGERCRLGPCIPACFNVNVKETVLDKIALESVADKQELAPFCGVNGHGSLVFKGKYNGETVAVRAFVFERGGVCPCVAAQQALVRRKIGDENNFPWAIPILTFFWNSATRVLLVVEPWCKAISPKKMANHDFYYQLLHDVEEPLARETIVVLSREDYQRSLAKVFPQDIQTREQACAIPTPKLLPDSNMPAGPDFEMIVATAEPVSDVLAAEPDKPESCESAGRKRPHEPDDAPLATDADDPRPELPVYTVRFYKPYLFRSQLCFPQHLFKKVFFVSHYLFTCIRLIPELNRAWRLSDNKGEMSYHFSSTLNLECFVNYLFQKRNEEEKRCIRSFFIGEGEDPESAEAESTVFLKFMMFFGPVWENPDPFNDVWPYYKTEGRFNPAPKDGVRQFIFRPGRSRPFTLVAQVSPGMNLFGHTHEKIMISYDLISGQFYTLGFDIVGDSPLVCLQRLNDLCTDHLVLEGVTTPTSPYEK